MSKSRTPVNYAFIDSQNLNLGILSQGWRLDFAKFRRYLKDKYHVEKAFLFIGYREGNQNLYVSLQEAGYLLVFKPTLEIAADKVKGNVDAELVLHTMIQYPEYDSAIIVSGDGDFHCLIEYLEQNHKLHRVLVPNRKYSSLLRHYHQFIVRLDAMQSFLAIKKTKISGSVETLGCLAWSS